MRTASAYYNELDPYAAQGLRNLIAAGHIAPGDVDERSIVDVQPSDIEGYTQCHFFAGIGGWSLAARLAGFPDGRQLWTGSCPCQPFSVAGKQEGQSDERHLWPVFFGLIRSRRPDVVMGEQVAAAVGKHWLDGVHSDLEGIGYTVGAAVVPACAVDAPHRRDRLWFVADAGRGGDECRCGPGEAHGSPRASEGHARQWERCGSDYRDGSAGPWGGTVAHPEHGGREGRNTDRHLGGPGAAMPSGEGHVADASSDRQHRGAQRHQYPIQPHQQAPRGDDPNRRSLVSGRNSTAWSGASWVAGADGKARRFEPGIRLLAHGVPARVGKLRAYGNAIVPQVAAEVIAAYLDAERLAA